MFKLLKKGHMDKEEAVFKQLTLTFNKYSITMTNNSLPNPCNDQQQ